MGCTIISRFKSKRSVSVWACLPKYFQLCLFLAGFFVVFSSTFPWCCQYVFHQWVMMKQGMRPEQMNKRHWNSSEWNKSTLALKWFIKEFHSIEISELPDIFNFRSCLIVTRFIWILKTYSSWLSFFSPSWGLRRVSFFMPGSGFLFVLNFMLDLFARVLSPCCWLRSCVSPVSCYLPLPHMTHELCPAGVFKSICSCSFVPCDSDRTLLSLLWTHVSVLGSVFIWCSRQVNSS